MNTMNTMRLKEGTDVKTVDGDKVGTVDQVVVDPSTNEVTHVVVEKGFLFTEDRVVPMAALRNGDDETVILEDSFDDLDEYPKFEQTHYIRPGRNRLPPLWGGWQGTPLFYYPPVGAAPYPYYPGVGVAKAKVTDRNVPMDTVVVGEGTKVTTTDGEHAGDVKETFTDDEGKISHILISKGFLFTTERLIPVNWVRQMKDSEIQLAVSTEIVEDLPEYDN